MGHKRRLRERPENYREDYLIIIAVEGAKTETNYFEAVNAVYRSSRFRIHVIPNFEDRSAPQHIIKNLDFYKNNNEIDENDFLFLVCDKDRWTDSILSSILQLCRQKNYKFIVSNPCFELWLILHFQDLSILSQEKQNKYFNNEKVNRNLRYIASKLKEFLPGYNHSYNKFETIVTNDFLVKAVAYSLKLDTGDSGWPCKMGTQVFRIAEKILQLTGN